MIYDGSTVLTKLSAVGERSEATCTYRHRVSFHHNKINKCIRLDELCSQSLPYIREIYHGVQLSTVRILVIGEHADGASLCNNLFWPFTLVTQTVVVV